MNKLGVKVYGDGIYHIDGIHYLVNSIKYLRLRDIYKYRVINVSVYGIELRIINKKK